MRYVTLHLIQTPKSTIEADTSLPDIFKTLGGPNCKAPNRDSQIIENFYLGSEESVSSIFGRTNNMDRWEARLFC